MMKFVRKWPLVSLVLALVGGGSVSAAETYPTVPGTVWIYAAQKESGPELWRDSLIGDTLVVDTLWHQVQRRWKDGPVERYLFAVIDGWFQTRSAYDVYTYTYVFNHDTSWFTLGDSVLDLMFGVYPAFALARSIQDWGDIHSIGGSERPEAAQMNSDTLFVYYHISDMLGISRDRSARWIQGIGLISEILGASSVTESPSKGRFYLRRLERNDSLLWGIPDAAVAVEQGQPVADYSLRGPRLSYDAAARTLRMVPNAIAEGRAGSEAAVQVEVVELTGRVMLHTSVSAAAPELRLQGLPRGRLFVRATGAGGTTVLPIAVR